MHMKFKMIALGLASTVLATGIAAALAPPAIGQQRDDAEVKKAKVGEEAPDFMLKDLDGKVHRLSDFRDKTVILEWFNGECPYVVRLHKNGALKGWGSKLHAKDEFVWLAINSNPPGTQGGGLDLNKRLKKQFEMEYPVLLDEDSEVGRLYEARTTPHMYVINPEGKLVYAGAIDNDPHGRLAEEDYINYVQQALDQLAKGETVTPGTTRPYGCSIKYQNAPRPEAPRREAPRRERP